MRGLDIEGNACQLGIVSISGLQPVCADCVFVDFLVDDKDHTVSNLTNTEGAERRFR